MQTLNGTGKLHKITYCFFIVLLGYSNIHWTCAVCYDTVNTSTQLWLALDQSNLMQFCPLYVYYIAIISTAYEKVPSINLCLGQPFRQHECRDNKYFHTLHTRSLFQILLRLDIFCKLRRYKLFNSRLCMN